RSIQSRFSPLAHLSDNRFSVQLRFLPLIAADPIFTPMAMPKHVLLSKLGWTDKGPVLKLRLLHTWKAGNPSRPDGFYEHSTLWTDELGVLIQAAAPKHLSDQLNEALTVGRIYFVSLFTQREAKPRWSSCSNDRILGFTSKTAFVCSTEDDSNFCLDSFEFREFEALDGVAGQSALLVDIVGRLVSATGITYFQKQHRSIRKRTVVIQNERDMSISVTLWGELADRLALQELIQMDGAAAVIIAFTSLNLSVWRGTLGASSTSATRIVVKPPVPHTNSLALHFAGAVGALGVLPTECDTPEKAKTLYRDSFRTISELQTVQSVSTMGGKFRCKATITDIDMSRDWCYLGCAVCHKAAVRHDAPFWCDKCSATVNPHELKHCYRIRVMVQDVSACAPFVLLGKTAEDLLGVSAGALLAAAPDRGGGCPPEIDCLLGKEYIFLINLPIGQAADSLADFCVSGVEKEDHNAAMDKKPHGPRFAKQLGQAVSTVPQLLIGHNHQPPTTSSSIVPYSSSTKRLREVESSATGPVDPLAQGGQQFVAPRPTHTLDMSKFTGPAAPAAFNAVLSAAAAPSTPAKGSPGAASSAQLQSAHDPNSPGINSPLAAITITTPKCYQKKKGKGTQSMDLLLNHHTLPQDNISASPGIEVTHVKSTTLTVASLPKDVPPSMLPINPLGQPLAKVKLEKLEVSRQKKKKSDASDDLPLSHLKAKGSKGRTVAKKLF
ncbi:unnamed protein product, partial [Linum tenue]